VRSFNDIVIFTASAVLLLAAISCNGPTKPDQQPIQLTLDDASCTDVYLKLQVSTEIKDRTVTLKRDNVELWTRTIDAAEIIVTDTNLLPGQTYTYTAKLLSPPPLWIGGNVNSQAQVRTMDTTSHNFAWQSYTLGDATGSSVLYDVAIVSEDPPLVYAVGQIYRNDTTFNAAKWDGQEWELKRITVNYNSNWITPPLNGVFAFSATDIWFSAGVPIHGDGNVWTQYHLFDMGILTPSDGSINKIWGSNSSNDMYFVGNKGTIVHYTGSSWTKMESPANGGAGGTNVPLKDVWGTSDGAEVWTLGYNDNTGEGILLRKQDAQWQTLWHSTQSTPHPYASEFLGTLWTNNKKEFFITGTGDIFRHSITNTNIIKREAVNLGNYAYRIRGTGKNNIMLCGDAAMVWHWNGATWYKYDNLYNLDDRLYSLAVSTSMIIAVGRTYSTFPGPAFIIVGRR
jgi:hypothetical protein